MQGSSASVHTGDVPGYLSAESFPDTEASRAASLPMKPFYLLLRCLEGVASSSEPSGLDREEFGQNKATTGDTRASRDTLRPKTKEDFWVCSLHPTVLFQLFS